MLRSAAVLVPCLLAIARAEPPRERPRGEPGRFDYYVLSLSWSPQHCAGPGGSRDRFQCGGGRQFGFIVHGLWPQYDRGWPQFCSTAPGPDKTAIDQTLSIMPSPQLIRHEWVKHGTCSGHSAAQYFEMVRRAFASIRIPPEFRQPLKSVMTTAARIEQRFLEDNRIGDASTVAIVCTGRFLQEVRLCLDKNLRPRACGADVRDSCRTPEVIMQPVR